MSFLVNGAIHPRQTLLDALARENAAGVERDDVDEVAANDDDNVDEDALLTYEPTPEEIAEKMIERIPWLRDLVDKIG